MEPTPDIPNEAHTMPPAEPARSDAAPESESGPITGAPADDSGPRPDDATPTTRRGRTVRGGGAGGGRPSRPGAAPELPREVQEEIEAAMAELEAAKGDEHAVRAPAIHGPRVIQGGREYRTGTVVSVGPTDVFVEFGPKELGVVERTQWPNDEGMPAVGNELEVVVNRYEPSESIYVCSRPGAVQKADWELLEPGQVVEGRVTGVTKGGLELEVAQHRAFMPASQVAIEHIPDLSVFVGEKLTCKVSRIDRRGRGNIVLTRREILEEERKQHADELRGSLETGQVVEGLVRKIMPFGAFVDLGGVDGLVHISDLTYDHVNHGEKNVGRYVKEGDRVKVQILSLDWDNNRISLGMKQIQADPFADAAAEIKEGDEVTGKVVRVTEFGAFVELSPGVEGLIHISELSWSRVAKCEDVVKPDEVVSVKVLKVDKDQRRIGLSLKQLRDQPKRAAKGKKGDREARTVEQIMKDDPAFRRLKEKFGKQGFKGGLG